MRTYQYKDSTGNHYRRFAIDSDAVRWFKRLCRDTHSERAVLIVWECGVPIPLGSS